MKFKEYFKKNKKDIIFYVTFLSALTILRIFVYAPVTVSGASMMPTLVDREKIITSKISKLKRFDIVPLKAPDAPDKLYIKRIIGLPGETLEYKNDILYINGEPYEEPYLDEYKEATDGLLTNDFSFEELYGFKEIPEETYFVMGDNRQNSKDSRMIGVIHKDDIMGTSKIVVWPPKKIGIF